MYKSKQNADKILSANNRSSLTAANSPNAKEEKKDNAKLRAIICVILLIVIFAGFALRLFNWQIVHGEEYKELSDASTRWR